ncbi:TonB-dependent receptor [Fulvivirga lutea]|uniref:TonB-dependent receptor n=1 Tax=Fulvivirga lutea TaxID=2810512 RepID=A0A975A077_9BACT|nr:TonB-dependent receptor [Fulvivirga lutea]QSE96910.1 TonB-dependent receptor [Fulvivirga lutea]
MKYLLVILFLAYSLVVLAQDATRGIVLDATSNEVLIGANVFSKSNWKVGASTDINGEFLVKNLEKGDTLIVSYIGYQEKEVVFNGEKYLTILLHTSVKNMAEVTVTAEKLVAEEFTYKKIKRLDIYLNPSAKADPLLATNSLPSSTTLDESANISFRGSSPDETGIFFNNVPLYDAVRFSQLNGIGTFGIFNTAIVDEMLVFPGNPPLEYGNTTSGLIAIKTTEEIPKEKIRTATVSLASYGFLISQKLNNSQALTAFSNYQPAAIIKAFNSDALQEIEDFSSIDLGISYLNVINENTIFKAFNYTLLEGYDFNYKAPTLNTTFEQRKKRNFTIINIRKQLGKSELSFNNNISFTNTQFNYADTDIELNYFDGFTSANYKYSTSKLSFKTGAAFDYREQHFDGTFYIYEYAEGPGYPTTSSTNTSELLRPEVYGFLTYFINDKWTIGGGLRKNLVTDNQSNFLSSQVSSKYQISTNSSLTFAIGNYHRYDFSESEKNLLNESKQVSIDYNLKNDYMNITASLFGKESITKGIKNELAGIELFLKSKLINKLTGQISYSLIDGISRENNGLEYPNKYDLDYFIRGNLEWRINANWTINSTFSFRQGNYHQPLIGSTYNTNLEVYEPEYAALTNQTRLPHYGIIDISISRIIPIKENLNIICFGTVNNILDKENIRTYQYNFDYTERNNSLFSQRTVYFGAVINF